MAPAEEYLNNFTEINQIRQKNITNGHESTDKNPTKDATPLPPLNLSQTGNICPIIEHIPHKDPISDPYNL